MFTFYKLHNLYNNKVLYEHNDNQISRETTMASTPKYEFLTRTSSFEGSGKDPIKIERSNVIQDYLVLIRSIDVSFGDHDHKIKTFKVLATDFSKDNNGQTLIFNVEFALEDDSGHEGSGDITTSILLKY